MSDFTLQDQIADLHKDILYDDLHKIDDFIKKNPQEKYAYNNQKESAVAVALTHFRPEIYKLLIINEFQSGSHEDIRDIFILKHASSEVTNIFFEIHRSTVFSNRHLIMLLSKSQFVHTTPEEKQCEYIKSIFDALKQLDEIPEVSLLMQIVAQCPKLQIIYDFSCDTVNGNHLGKTENFYKINNTKHFCFTIESKKLLEKYGCNEVHGIMAQKFCYYALNMVFKNKSKPYEKDDKRMEKVFEVVLSACKLHSCEDHIIRSAFDFDTIKKTTWHAELIARVPHMLAAYKHIPKEIKYLRGFFSKLFNFYDSTLQPRLKQTFYNMKSDKILKKINDYSGISEKLQKINITLEDTALDDISFPVRIQNFKSNCVEFTIKVIYEKIKESKQLDSVILLRLKHFENINVLQEIEELTKICDKTMTIVDCDGIAKNRILKIVQVCGKLEIKKVVFVSTETLENVDIENIEVEHGWLDVNKQTEKKLLTIQEGADVKINHICSAKYEQTEEAPFDQLVVRNKKDKKASTELKIFKSNQPYFSKQNSRQYKNMSYEKIDHKSVQTFESDQSLNDQSFNLHENSKKHFIEKDHARNSAFSKQKVSTMTLTYEEIENIEVNHDLLDVNEETQKKLLEVEQGTHVELKQVWSEKTEAAFDEIVGKSDAKLECFPNQATSWINKTRSDENISYNNVDVKALNMFSIHKNLEDQITDLHQDIDCGDLHEVVDFITRNPQEKYAYNDQKESAVAVAIKHFRPDIYKLLIDNDFKAGSHEDIAEVFKSLDSSKDDAKTLFKIHRISAVKLSLGNVKTMWLKSQLHYTAPKQKRGKYFQRILEGLKHLDKIPEVSLLMEILIMCPKLEIIFDFSRESVDGIHLAKTNEIRGVTHTKDFCITIGAKNLLNYNKCSEVYGTMAHEFCHYALNLVFQNNCRPYGKDDQETEKEFQEVWSACKKKCFEEHIVQLSFGGKKSSQHSELIVRVPHMLAAYNDDSIKILQMRKVFPELFNFYENMLQPKLKQTILTTKATQMLKRINVDCGVEEKLKNYSLSLKHEAIHNFEFSAQIQNLKSNCVELTMKMIYEKLKKSHEFINVIYTKLENLENEKIFNDIELLLEIYESILMVVDCDGIVKTKMSKTMRKCWKLERKPKLVFVSNETIEEENLKLNHSWLELTEDSQKKLMEVTVNLQGAEIGLKNIWSGKCEKNEVVPLDELIKGKEIKIGEINKFSGIHINRCFVLASMKRDSKRNYNPTPPTANKILSKIEDTKIFLLSDAPGNGKSTELKFLSTFIKGKMPDRWICLIDLKKHVEVFKGDIEGSSNFKSDEDIANFLRKYVLKLKSFESRIFSEMFKNNQVIVMMDGFDEISPSYKKFVMAFAVAIRKKTKNQLWISTRPNLEKELEKELETIALRLTEFNKDDQKVYFNRIFMSQKRRYQDFQREIESFFNEIEKGNETDAAVTNPLLLRMIANLFMENPNVKLHSSNLYTIYDAFVDEMFQRLNKKGPEAGRDTAVFMRMKVNITDFHKKIAIISEFGVQSIKNFCRSLSQPTDDQLYRAGLMYIGVDNKYFFVHKTFKEFFIAQMLREKCFNHEFHSKEEFAKFFDILTKVMKDDDDNYSVVRKFLDNALENFEMNLNLENFKIAAQTVKSREKIIFFNKAADDECFNVIKLISQLIEDKERVANTWVKEQNGDDNLLIKYFRKQTLKNVEKLWKFAEDFFNHAPIKKFLTHKTSKSKMNSFLASVANIDDKVFSHYQELVEKYLSRKEQIKEKSYALISWQTVCSNEIGSLKHILPRLKTLYLGHFKDSLKLFTENTENIIKICVTRDLEIIKAFFAMVKEYSVEDELKNTLRAIDKAPLTLLLDTVEENGAIYDFVRRLIIDEHGNLPSILTRYESYNIYHITRPAINPANRSERIGRNIFL